MHDWDKYDDELEEFKERKRMRGEKRREDDFINSNDPFYYDDDYPRDTYWERANDEIIKRVDEETSGLPAIIEEEYDDETGLFKIKNKKNKKEKEADEFYSYWEKVKSDDKTATLNTFTPVKILKKVDRDIELLFRKLSEKGKEGLVYLFIKQEKDGALIYDYYFPEQEVSGASCDPDAGTLAKWIIKNRNNKKKDDLRGWAHSHNTMGCFWSTTDDNYARQLTTGFDMTKPKILFSMVYSFRGKEAERLTRFDVNSVLGRITIDNLDLEIIDDKMSKRDEKVYLKRMNKYFDKLIKQRVKEKTYSYVITTVDSIETKIGEKIQKSEPLTVFEEKEVKKKLWGYYDDYEAERYGRYNRWCFFD